MKIAVLGTAHKPITRNSFGGTEAFTYELVEGLVKKRHDVTLFAHPNSKTSARLLTNDFVEDEEFPGDPFWPNQLNNLGLAFNELAKSQFDIIHNNLYETYPSLPFLQFLDRSKTIFISTVHNDYFSFPNAEKIFGSHKKEIFVFVSKFASNQAKEKGFNNSYHIYNGVPLDTYKFNNKPTGDYLLWLGRIQEKKGVLDAIEAARITKTKLIISGVVDSEKNKIFFETKVKPFIDGKNIAFSKPESIDKKVKLYQNALGFIFPVKWDEPFGLVAAEAMACGTPVIGYKRGAFPEVVEDGLTGFVLEEGDINGIAKNIRNLTKFDRKKCRERVEKFFSSKRMVDSYESFYKKLLI